MQFGELHSSKLDGKNFKISILVPHFNEELGLELLENVQKELFENNVKPGNVKIIRVAGSLELPLAAKHECKNDTPDAIIALGIVIKGRTDHYELVNQTCYYGLMQAQLQTEVPIIFGVLTCQTPEQAIKRVKATELNKGREFARAAIMQATINSKL